MIRDIDHGRDVSFCVRVWEEIAKKNHDKKKNEKWNNERELKDLLCCCAFKVTILEKFKSIMYTEYELD